MRGKAHVLFTWNDVIWPIEKILEALEQSFTSKFTLYHLKIYEIIIVVRSESFFEDCHASCSESLYTNESIHIWTSPDNIQATNILDLCIFDPFTAPGRMIFVIGVILSNKLLFKYVTRLHFFEAGVQESCEESDFHLEQEIAFDNLESTTNINGYLDGNRSK